LPEAKAFEGLGSPSLFDSRDSIWQTRLNRNQITTDCTDTTDKSPPRQNPEDCIIREISAIRRLNSRTRQPAPPAQVCPCRESDLWLRILGEQTVPTSIRIRCFVCRARIKAPVQLLEKVCPCPGCGKEILVRPQGPPDSGPILLLDEDPPVRKNKLASRLQPISRAAVQEEDLARTVVTEATGY
jgi:hypothetical protein